MKGLFKIFHFSFMPARLLVCYFMGGIIANLYRNKIPIDGLIFDTSSPEISSIIKAELYFRLYERGEIRLIQKYLPESYDVIELGSSIGIVSSLVKKRLCKDARLICVEAHPALIKQTEVNLKFNRLYHNVECLNKAVHYAPDSLSVFFTPGLLSRMGTLTFSNPRHNSIPVESVTLSELKDAYRINDFTLIADIEGIEADIIREEKEALSHCQHLFLELHDTRHHGVAIHTEDMLKDLIDVHKFHLQERQGNVVYLNRRSHGG
jgi:FkbM family methyltransferase